MDEPSPPINLLNCGLWTSICHFWAVTSIQPYIVGHHSIPARDLEPLPQTYTHLGLDYHNTTYMCEVKDYVSSTLDRIFQVVSQSPSRRFRTAVQ